MERLFRAVALIALPALLLGASLTAGSAEAWKALKLKVPGGAVTDLEIAGGTIFVQAGRQWMALSACTDQRICFTPKRPPERARPPAGGLADGGLATSASGDIRKAWFAGPTDIYGHGILGDRIEAAMLVAQDAGGTRHKIAAGAGVVFEDLQPRLADLDGDGRTEIVAIRTFTDAGASLAVYGLVRGKLSLLAQTPPIGLPSRWRNPSAIADFDARPGLEIAEVVTPHIGGTLRLWRFDRAAGALEAVADAFGFSNHFIGSRELRLSAAADLDADAISELALPSADRTALRIMAFSAGKITEVAAVNLPARIDKAVGVIAEADGPAFVTGLESGELVLVAAPDSATFCVENRDKERLLFIAQSPSGKRQKQYLKPAETGCFPRQAIATVWVFEDLDALEGCSVLVPATAKSLALQSYASFDNCDWRVD
ncbi:MAG: hypothetical protein OEL78_01360 [Hyphomicrobiales bacterium]|nr:hypothetical protein [Hyphomicrobiales bacterium]